MALHSCDNTHCINPDHIRAGTGKDNVADMTKRGRARFRARKGEENTSAKLTHADIRNIRADSRPITEIAKDYPKVSRDTVYRAKTGRYWKSTR